MFHRAPTRAGAVCSTTQAISEGFTRADHRAAQTLFCPKAAARFAGVDGDLDRRKASGCHGIQLQTPLEN